MRQHRLERPGATGGCAIAPCQEFLDDMDVILTGMWVGGLALEEFVPSKFGTVTGRLHDLRCVPCETGFAGLARFAVWWTAMSRESLML